MYPRSKEFDDTTIGLKGQIKLAQKCTILSKNAATNTDLVVTDGSVTINGKQTTRRSAWFTINVPSLVPTDANSLLTPFVNEFQLFRGVYIPSTSVAELLPLGVFGITDTEVYDSNDNFSIRCTGYDRSKLVTRHKLVTDLVVTSGTIVTTALQTMIRTAVPSIQFGVTPTTVTTPTLHYQSGDDMWEKATDLAASIGYALYFDVDGVCQIQPVPDPSTQPDSWTFSDDPNYSIMIYSNKHQSNTSTVNHVIVIGENPDGPGTGPITAEAKDTDPNSPTNINGVYGDVVDTLRDRHITSQLQAQMMANGLLLNGLGISEEVELTNLVHPAFDVNDVIRITRARSRLDARYVIDGMSIPLTHNRAMTISTRKRTVAFV